MEISDLDLAEAFAAHADESMAIANEMFAAAAEVWLRKCVWPGCLTVEQQLRLADEIEYVEIHGEQHPNPDLADQRTVCRCVDSGRGGGPDGKPPRWLRSVPLGTDSPPTRGTATVGAVLAANAPATSC
jgi:hypothetical protein